jgi:D-threonate/D-erythronate kinase
MAIISDDLTGAADTGIQFVYAGLRALVLLDPVAGDLPPADVIVGVTESRHLSPELARRQVTAWARMLSAYHPQEVYKKIDSTLRGNLGAELDACMSAFPGRLAVVAPAYPAAGRTTVNGRHFMHGRPLEETEVARDPTTPVLDSLIPGILARQTARRIGQIRLADLESAETLAQALQRNLAEGAEILVSDACTDQHLADLAAGVRALGRPILWTGSAGLARQLLPPACSGVPNELLTVSQPLLTIAGSVSQTLRRQIDHYCTDTGAACIIAEAGALTGTGATADAEVSRVSAEALSCLQAGRSAVVTTSLAPVVIADSGPDMVQMARVIADRLGDIARVILTSGWSGSLVLSGGDTALGVCRRLGSTAIRLRAELVPGVALGSLVGGAHENLSVITKAGSFGEVDVLCQISRLSPSPWATRPESARK